MDPLNLLDKRIPFAAWEIVDVVFTSANADSIIPHTLQPQFPHEVRFIVIDTNSNGVVYRGYRAPGVGYLVLRTSVVGNYRILLLIEAYTDVTQALPRTIL